VVSAGAEPIILEALLTSGTTSPTEGEVTYAWFIQNNKEYESLNFTGSVYEVAPEEISSYGIYKCQALYKGKTYTAYASVYDKTDPI
jgi:hypothetical protein